MASIFKIIQEGKADEYIFKFTNNLTEWDFNCDSNKGMMNIVNAIISTQNGLFVEYVWDKESQDFCSWISISTGNLFWEENTTEQERSCTIIFTQDFSYKILKLTLHQEAAINYVFKWTSTEDKDIYDTGISWEADYFPFVKTNGFISTKNNAFIGWNASTEANWIEVGTGDNDALKATVKTVNENMNSRTGIIHLVQNDSNNKLSWTLKQNGKPKPIIYFQRIMVTDDVISVQRVRNLPIPTSTVEIDVVWSNENGNYRKTFILAPNDMEMIYAISSQEYPYTSVPVISSIKPREDDTYNYAWIG